MQTLQAVVPRRVELRTSTLSVWRSNQLSYETIQATLPIYGISIQQDEYNGENLFPQYTIGIVPNSFCVYLTFVCTFNTLL